MSTSNTITITACDNQLAIYAVNLDGNSSYQICDIQSGYNNTVNVPINLVAGSAASDTIRLNGVTSALTPAAQDFALPSGNYALVYTGLNWGGPTQFAFTFNDHSPALPVGSVDKVGAVWNLGDLSMTFTI